MKKISVLAVALAAVGLTYMVGCKKDPAPTGQTVQTASIGSNAMTAADYERFIGNVLLGKPQGDMIIANALAGIEAYANYKLGDVSGQTFGNCEFDTVYTHINGLKGIIKSLDLQSLTNTIIGQAQASQSASTGAGGIQTGGGQRIIAAVDVALQRVETAENNVEDFLVRTIIVVGTTPGKINGFCDYSSTDYWAIYDGRPTKYLPGNTGENCGPNTKPGYGSPYEMLLRLNSLNCGRVEKANALYYYSDIKIIQFFSGGLNSADNIAGDNNRDKNMPYGNDQLYQSSGHTQSGPLHECLTPDDMTFYTNSAYNNIAFGQKQAYLGANYAQYSITGYAIDVVASYPAGYSIVAQNLTVTYGIKQNRITHTVNGVLTGILNTATK